MRPDLRRRRADGKLSTLSLGLVGLLVLAACGDDKFGPQLEEGAVPAGVDPAVVVRHSQQAGLEAVPEQPGLPPGRPM